MNEEQLKMTPLKTGEIIKNIYAINNTFVNFFIIKHNGGITAIDAGADKDLSLQALEQLGINKDSITTLLMTHDHGDHTAMVMEFKNAKIYGMGLQNNIADGDKLDIQGETVGVIHTPGHKDNHVSFLWNSKYLFAGDVMSIKDDKIDIFNHVYNKSSEMQREDLKRLSQIEGIEYIISSHYGITDKPIW